MKTLLIGRGDECNIVLSDNSDLISREHVRINLYPFGKIQIIDLSRNGTYVNGIKITSNTPFPVTRNDVISFAHVKQLDWNLIPRYYGWAKQASIGILVLLAIISTCITAGYMKHEKQNPAKGTVADTLAIKDSTAKKTVPPDTVRGDSATNPGLTRKPGPKKKPDAKKPDAGKADSTRDKSIPHPFY